MTFRSRLLLIFAVTVATAVALVAWIVSAIARDAFERADERHTAALVAQFNDQYLRKADEVSRRVAAIAGSETVQRIAIEANTASPDYAAFYGAARELAAANGLEFLELTTADGAIISSAQLPERFGYRENWLAQAYDGSSQSAFLKRETVADRATLALIALRTVKTGSAPVQVAGGVRLDEEFLTSLARPEGMDVRLYQAPDSAVPRSGSAETWHTIPLRGRDNGVLAVLAVGSSRREVLSLVALIRWTGIAVGGAGVLLALIVAWWATARITRPVRQLAAGAREVAAGKWETRVAVDSPDEIGDLGRAFNHMTGQLIEQRDRLVQVERVAAWRELARRLAHELKNPLFPLQITVENLQRARDSHPEEFDEVFRESTSTLLAELNDLKTIVGRFSDFARMPPPHFQTVDVNDLVRETVRLFDAQLKTRTVERVISLDENLPPIQADPEQLTRALRNLVLNALDAMPSGGTLTISSQRRGGIARLEVSDTGAGLTPEERDRLFTPYYTTRQHGTGLGLAIVQSVVSDHGGSIAVDSQPGRGAAFRLDLPLMRS